MALNSKAGIRLKSTCVYIIIKSMSKVLKKLKGKRTYLVAVLVGVVAVLGHLGYLSPEAQATLLGLLGAGGLASLRAGVKK